MMLRKLCGVLVAVLLVGAMMMPPIQGALAYVPPLGSIARFSRYPGSVPARVPTHQQSSSAVIDFEDLTASTQPGERTIVSDQYASLGVTFNNPTVVNYDEFPGFVHSGSNAIQQCVDSPEETCTTPLVMTFDEPQRRVKVWVGFADSLEGAFEVRLTAFDADEGGEVVSSASAALGPSDDPRIPVETPLEVTTDGAVIRRVDVTFPQAVTFAPWLVLDDVEFETVASVAACPPGTEPPIVALQQPTSGLRTQEDAFPLQGRVTTSEDLIEATLAAEGSAGTARRDVLSTLIAPEGGSFGPMVFDDLLSPDINTVTLTVRNCAGPNSGRAYVDYAEITEGTHYALAGLEVTQTIQDLDNSVRLIAEKRTFVRAYLVTTGEPAFIQNVSGDLLVCRDPGGDTQSCLDDPDGFQRLHAPGPVIVDNLSEPSDLATKRQRLETSLFFELPLDWTVPDAPLHLEIDPLSLSPSLPCDNCNNVTVDGNARFYEFVAAPPLIVDVVDVTFTREGEPYVPLATDHEHLESWLRRAYPMSDIRVSYDLNIQEYDVQPECQVVGQEMFRTWFYETYPHASGFIPVPATRFYGLVKSIGSDKTGAIRGCALIGEKFDPGNPPYNDHFATGPAGSGEPYPWDGDGSYADFYGGHELAHTFGRLHPGACADEPIEDHEYPPKFVKGKQISSSEREYFGFDAGDDRVGVKMHVVEPDTASDVITYCENIWVTDYTYEGILDFALYHVEEDFNAGDVVEALAPGEDATPEPVVYSAEVAVNIAPPAQEVVLVLGTINLNPAHASVDFRPFSRVPGDAVTPRDPNGTYSIVMQGAGRTPLETYPFEPRGYEDIPMGNDRIAQLAEAVPWVDGTERIAITKFNPTTNTNDEIGARDVSRFPPVVDIVSPSGGQQLSGMQTVKWTVTDGNTDDELTASLLYSTDSGATWQGVASGIHDQQYSVATGIHEQQYTVDLDRIPGSEHALFRVIVTDGVNTGQADSDGEFTVAPKSPSVGIIAPADGKRFGTSETIVMVGQASDLEQGELDGESLKWSSDLQGDLGEGPSIAVGDLVPGLHTITLTATDNDSPAATASVVIEIVDDEVPTFVNPNEQGTPPETLLPEDGLFLYDDAEEAGAFYASDGGGQLLHLRTFDVLLNGWSAVVPGNFGGDKYTDLFFYDTELGVGEFLASDGQGGLQLLSGNENFTKGWDIIVPGDFDGLDPLTDLFFYDRAEGVGKFYTTDGAGRIQLLGEVPLAQGWTSIVAGNFDGDERTDLLFYDMNTGLAQRYATDGKGGITQLGDDVNLGAGWTRIVSGAFDDAEGTDLFLFNAETGEAAFSSGNGAGEIVSLDPTTLPSSWTTVLAGNFSGGDDRRSDLFFYDREVGLGTFFATDSAGGLQELTSVDGITAGWDLIVPGNFGGP